MNELNFTKFLKTGLLSILTTCCLLFLFTSLSAQTLDTVYLANTVNIADLGEDPVLAYVADCGTSSVNIDVRAEYSGFQADDIILVEFSVDGTQASTSGPAGPTGSGSVSRSFPINAPGSFTLQASVYLVTAGGTVATLMDTKTTSVLAVVAPPLRRGPGPWIVEATDATCSVGTVSVTAPDDCDSYGVVLTDESFGAVGSAVTIDRSETYTFEGVVPGKYRIDYTASCTPFTSTCEIYENFGFTETVTVGGPLGDFGTVVCSNNGSAIVKPLDDGCAITLFPQDLATGVTCAWLSLELLTPSAHADLPAGGRDAVNAALKAQEPAYSITATIPGTYRYSILDSEDNVLCWNEVILEDKGAPVCNPKEDAEPPVQICGEVGADGKPVLRADPSGVDDLAPEIVSCYVLETYGDAGIEPWFDILEATDFDDCEKVIAPFHEDFRIDVCGDISAARQRMRILAAANGFTAPEFPTGDDYPDDYEVCEVRIRVWYATDWQGNESDRCAQAVVIVRPKTVHLDMRVTTECGAPTATATTGLDAPYLVDFTNGTDIVTCPLHSGKKMKFSTTGEFCKFTATYDDDNVIKTCDDKPGCEGLDKTARDWTIWDWCNDALPTVVLHETYMGDPENTNMMRPAPGQKEFTQIISEEDNVPPSLPTTLPAAPTVWPNAFDCDVKVQFSNITATDACQGVIVADYEVTVTVDGGHNGAGSVTKYSAADAQAGIDMPRGATWTISASAWDCCGNYSNANYSGMISADDDQAPTCIANDELEVSVVKTDPHGSTDDHRVGARVKAEDLDDTSHDNCSEVTLLVRDPKAAAGTPNAAFREYVEYDWSTAEFTTASEGTCVVQKWLELQVTDESGNSSVCNTLVTFRDELAPVLPYICNDVRSTISNLKSDYQLGKISKVTTITCLDKVPEFADVEAWGTCLTYAPVLGSDPFHCPKTIYICNQAYNDVVEVLWKTTTATKVGEHSTTTATTTEVIVIKEEFEEKFTFPYDYKVECTADGGYDIPAPSELEDILTSEGCSDWIMNVTEKTFSGTDGACYEIIRNYEFINSCRWDPIDRDDNVQIDRDCADNDDDGKLLEDHGDSQVMLFYSSALRQDGGVATDATDDCQTWAYNPVTKRYEWATTSLGAPITGSGAASDLEYLEDGYFNYTQIIKVFDDVVPTAMITSDSGCDVDMAGCLQGTAEFTVTIDDVCSEASFGDWYINSVGNQSGWNKTGNTFSGTGLAIGDYTIHVEVLDACNNFIWATETVTVDTSDCKKPTPIITTAFAPLMETEMVDIWLSDVLVSYSDNCSGPFMFSIQHPDDFDGEFPDAPVVTSSAYEAAVAAGQETISARYTCDDLFTNLVYVWMKDAAGNTEYVEASLFFQDNNNACGTQDPDVMDVAGKITKENGIDPIENVTLSVVSDQLSPLALLVSDAFNLSIPMNGNTTVTPSKNNDHLNGVGTADLVALQRHILGITTLSSAYDLIAADVSNNDFIGPEDMLQISRLVLGIYDEFPNVDSWKFVSKAHVFTNPSSPWGYPTAVNFDGLDENAQADFIGIKMGDLTGNASEYRLLGDDMPIRGEMAIAIDDANIAAGTSKTIEFTAKDFNDFTGYQFSIELANGVTFEDVNIAGLPNHTDGNFGLNRLDEGIITTNWANERGIDLDNGTVLFTLTVSTDADINVSDAIKISSAVTPAEAYNQGLEVFDVVAQFNRTNNGFELLQNAPNPFSSETMIGFNLPKAGLASLKIMDVSGRVLKAINNTYAAGFHQVSINKSELGATGVLYYQLDTDFGSATKKMVILE